MDEQTEDTPELAMVRKHCNELGEHFEAVSIFCSRHDQGGEHGTVHINLGVGNYFARIGHIKDYIIKEDEGTRINQRKEQE